MIRTVVGLAVAVPVTVWHSLRVVGSALVGTPWRRGGIYDRVPHQWSGEMLTLFGIHVEAEPVPAAAPCVYAANHLSFADVWALSATLPDSHRFVAKRELARVPLFGWAVTKSRQIWVERRDLKQALAAYDRAAAQIHDGLSAVVFVEGTRSRDGTLQAFKKGPFVLAIRAQVPVVPVVLSGSGEIWPRGRIGPGTGTIRVRFGAPIPTTGLGYEDRNALAGRCREAMIRLGARPAAAI